MNESEVVDAVRRHRDSPIKLRAVLTLTRLMNLVNDNSDGWAHWAPPVRAARRLMEFIQKTPAAQATEAELKKAYAPVKAFLTRWSTKGYGGTPKARTIEFA
jgi:hypothetical protein